MAQDEKTDLLKKVLRLHPDFGKIQDFKNQREVDKYIGETVNLYIQSKQRSQFLLQKPIDKLNVGHKIEQMRASLIAIIYQMNESLRDGPESDDAYPTIQPIVLKKDEEMQREKKKNEKSCRHGHDKRVQHAAKNVLEKKNEFDSVEDKIDELNSEMYHTGHSHASQHQSNGERQVAQHVLEENGHDSYIHSIHLVPPPERKDDAKKDANSVQQIMEKRKQTIKTQSANQLAN